MERIVYEMQALTKVFYGNPARTVADLEQYHEKINGLLKRLELAAIQVRHDADLARIAALDMFGNESKNSALRAVSAAANDEYLKARFECNRHGGLI